MQEKAGSRIPPKHRDQNTDLGSGPNLQNLGQGVRPWPTVFGSPQQKRGKTRRTQVNISQSRLPNWQYCTDSARSFGERWKKTWNKSWYLWIYLKNEKRCIQGHKFFSPFLILHFIHTASMICSRCILFPGSCMTKFCSSSSSGVQCGREAFACGAPSSKRLELKRKHGNICDICGICLLFHTRQDFRKLDEALPYCHGLEKAPKMWKDLDRFGTSGMLAWTFQHIQSDSNHLLLGSINWTLTVPTVCKCFHF